MLLAIKLPTLGLIANLLGIGCVAAFIFHQGLRKKVSKIIGINLDKLIWGVAAIGLGFILLFFTFGSISGRSRLHKKTVSSTQKPEDKEKEDEIKTKTAEQKGQGPSSTEKFNQALKRGTDGLSAGDFKKAQDAFVEALGIKGYSGPKDKAEDGLRIAKIGLGNEPAARATVEKWVKALDDQQLDLAVKGELSPTDGYTIPDTKLKEIAPIIAKEEKTRRQPLVELTITEPKQNQQIMATAFYIKGTTEQGAKVTIDDHPASVKNSSFSYKVEVGSEEGKHQYTVKATKEERKDKVEKVNIKRELTDEERNEKRKGEYSKLDYKILKKNPDLHKGEKVRYKGKVVQIQEDETGAFLRVDVGSMDVIAVMILKKGNKGDTGIVDDQVKTFYGTILGSFEYESQAGWEISIPSMNADFYE